MTNKDWKTELSNLLADDDFYSVIEVEGKIASALSLTKLENFIDKLVMAEKEKTIEEIESMLVSKGNEFQYSDVIMLLENFRLKQPQTSSPSEQCTCICHSGVVSSTCQHCQPREGREGKK